MLQCHIALKEDEKVPVIFSHARGFAGVDILTKKQKLCPQDLRNSAPVSFLWALITRDSQIICNFS